MREQAGSNASRNQALSFPWPRSACSINRLTRVTDKASFRGIIKGFDFFTPSSTGVRLTDKADEFDAGKTEQSQSPC